MQHHKIIQTRRSKVELVEGEEQPRQELLTTEDGRFSVNRSYENTIATTYLVVVADQQDPFMTNYYCNLVGIDLAVDMILVKTFSEYRRILFSIETFVNVSFRIFSL